MYAFGYQAGVDPAENLTYSQKLRICLDHVLFKHRKLLFHQGKRSYNIFCRKLISIIYELHYCFLTLEHEP